MSDKEKKKAPKPLSPEELENRVWVERDGLFFLRDSRDEKRLLENHVYILEQDMVNGTYLRKLSEDFEFDYKIYGLESKLINRTLKTYGASKGNLGVLLNGLKGTGKTVTSKILCNKLEQPVIIVDRHLANCHIYLNDIPQDITIFIDEYEKIFENDADMLTIMDGALNSIYRRVFILTTNKLHVNENLLQRPGRIRYLKTFKDLGPAVIREILEDILVHKKFTEQLVQFISSLEIITVDIVKAITHEVNVHEEPPSAFSDVFNVRQITGKYDVLILSPDRTQELLWKKGAKVGPRRDFDPEDTMGNSFSIDGDYLGEVVAVLDTDTIKVRMRIDKESRAYPYFIPIAKEEKFLNANLEIIPDSVIGQVDDDDDDEDDEDDEPKKTKNKKEAVKPIWADVTIKVTHSWMTHKTYHWDNYGMPAM